MQIISWNVNGLRACAKKGFLTWLESQPPSIIGLQEVRARTSDLSDALTQPEGWATHFFEGEKAGYSGVGIYSSWSIDEVSTSIGEEQFDREGRVQMARFGRLWVVNVYFPNGGRDLKRVDYKLAFYTKLLEKLQPKLDAGEPIFVIGDYNTAHHPIDLARPKPNKTKTGFLPIERDALQVWIDAGFVDTYRHDHPEEEGAYSWWSYYGGARARNVGWRIDYVMASPAAMPFVQDSFIAADVTGSDHCPVGVIVDPAILGDVSPERVEGSEHLAAQTSLI